MIPLDDTIEIALPTPYRDLEQLFLSLQKPYNDADIVRFNLLYQKIYPNLAKTERQAAEGFVDALIAGVEREGLRSKIYGVV